MPGRISRPGTHSLGNLIISEVVEFTPDWLVELSTPLCGLKFQCQGEPASHGVRVHNCVFEFACGKCVREYQGRLRATFDGYDALQCSKCKGMYTRKSYYKVTLLNKRGKRH